MTTFEEAVAFLDERDIQFRQGYEYVGEAGKGRHQEDRNYIESVAIPFSAEEWLDVIDTEGKALGACCATISSARDILLAQLRQGRWISTKDLWEFTEILSHHDGFEFMLPKNHEHYEAWRSWQQDQDPQDDPIYRLWQIWDKIKDHALLNTPRADPPAPKSKYAEHPVHSALSVAYNSIHMLFWATSCFGEGREDDPAWMAQQKHARRQLVLARVTPSLRTLFEHLSQFDQGDFKGFAICSKEDPKEILDNRMGQCIFHTREEAQGMIDAWAKRDDENEEDFGRKDIREKTTIRPVSVSAKTGLTFLDKESP